MNRREFLVGGGAITTTLLADEKTTDGGLAPVSWAERTGKNHPVLPAGAHNAHRFATRCIGCHLCAAACPQKCLRPSTSLSRLGKVELDFRYGYCRPDCTRCGTVCPVNAIESLGVIAKRTVHVGHAVWDKSICVRTVHEDDCHACEKHCPTKAISIINGFPVVNESLCIGCGACEHYCPARPKTAIHVEGYEYHREIRPLNEEDLIDEMRSLASEGYSLIVAKNGIIEYISKERMIKPLTEALNKNPDLLQESTVFDKVVGKAAAKLHIQGRVRKVITPVIAAKAKTMLENAGIVVIADEVVPMILNRDRTGECPLDSAL